MREVTDKPLSELDKMLTVLSMFELYPGLAAEIQGCCNTLCCLWVAG